MALLIVVILIVQYIDADNEPSMLFNTKTVNLVMRGEKKKDLQSVNNIICNLRGT